MLPIIARRLAMRGGLLSLVLAFLICCAPACPAATGDRTPILVELFTSQGCSSCPPADEWVQRLDATQPIANAEFIVLSEHVDYWNHDGWADPYSSAQLTERQEQYREALRGSNVYTPQVILDGNLVLKLSDRQEMLTSLHEAEVTRMLPVNIQSPTLTVGEPDVLTGTIMADGSGQSRSGEVYVAVALNETQTDVLAGENDGKKLTNVAVVKELVKIGKMDKGKDFQQAFRVKLWKGADPSNLRVVAFVQEPGPGEVLGAAMTKEIVTQPSASAATRASVNAE